SPPTPEAPRSCWASQTAPPSRSYGGSDTRRRRRAFLFAVDRLGGQSRFILQGANRLPSVVIRNRDGHLGHVVRVIGLPQRVAEAARSDVGTRLSGRGRERRVHGDANEVVAGRHRRLPVAAIEQEVLAAKLPNVHVGPALADALIPRNADGAAAREVPLVVGIACEELVFLDVDHAEAAFGRSPHES